MVVKEDDWVKIVKGTAAVGAIGQVTKVKKVMATVCLYETRVSVTKKKKFLETIPPPVPAAIPAVAALTEDEGITKTSNNPNMFTDVLVDIPDMTDENMNHLLESAVLKIESVSGLGTVKVGLGKGLILRGMGQIKVKMTSPDDAATVVEYYQNTAMTLEGQACIVSYAEAGRKAPSNYSTKLSTNYISRKGNSSAFPTGRSLADRVRDGTKKQSSTNKRRAPLASVGPSHVTRFLQDGNEEQSGKKFRSAKSSGL